MYKIMILWNTFSSEISWPISTKFHVNPIVEKGLRVCSNGHASLTVMLIYGKCFIDCHAHIWWINDKKKHTKKKQKTLVFLKTENCSNDPCNDRFGITLHNICICISAVPVSLRWASCGPWASCFIWSRVYRGVHRIGWLSWWFILINSWHISFIRCQSANKRFVRFVHATPDDSGTRLQNI